MNRREFIKQTGAAFAVASVTDSVCAQTASEKSDSPNILVIFSDQQHWQALGFVDDFFETPNIDALVEESIVFERSFCTTPQCSPSRSSMLSGFYPSHTGVLGNVGASGGAPMTQPTVAPELHAAGFRTGYFGKWHLGDEEAACIGWDEKIFKTNDRVAEEGALAFLKNPDTRSRPFALFVSINNPHDVYGFKTHETREAPIPLSTSWESETFAGKPPIQKQFMEEDQGKVIVGKPRSEWERYRDCYREKTQRFDTHVGAILDELKRQGQWENTVVIVTSDHGDMDTQHKLIFKGPFMYEHMMRVPLMVRMPKARGGGRRIDDVDIVHVDLVPTLRDLCGLPAQLSHGRSFAPLLIQEGAYPKRDFVVGQYYSKQKWANPIRMIRTERYKLNRHIRWGDELYDLESDPHELINLASDPKLADIKSGLIAKLDAWIEEHNDPFYSLDVSTRRGRALGSDE